MSWKNNPIMEWSKDGYNWTRISDHGRSPLSVSIERIESRHRMANGALRRYVVAKKRTFSCSWDNFPSVATPFLTNGQPGTWMEEFHNSVDHSFKMRLRSGLDRAYPNTNGLIRTTNVNESDNEREFTVMITDFSKEIVKRSPGYDLWSLDITLEEC